MRPIQYFSDEYLEQCKSFSTESILEYLENFRLLQQPTDKEAEKAEEAVEYVLEDKAKHLFNNSL